PSSNRPLSNKRKPFKKGGGRGADDAPRSFSRSKRDDRDDRSSAPKRPYASKGGSFQKRDRNESSDRPFRKDFNRDGAPERKPRFSKAGPPRDFKKREDGEGGYKRPFATKGGSFQKRDRDDRKTDRSFKGGNDRNDSGERKSRPFSAKDPGGFTKRDDRSQGDKRSPGGFTRKKFSDESSDRERPRERKSFVESRLERQRQAVSNQEPVAAPAQDDLIRLNKFIANSGVCSRREADDLITMGLITVNGKSVTELGYKVKLTDDVRYEGKRLKAEKPVYILLNKPKGYITTTDDPQERNTVMQLIHGACKERVCPVGRLDRNTSGLLLLTNDGDLTDKLTHPSYNVKKIYKAELDRPLTKADFQKILDGVRLEEGKALVDDLAIVSDDAKTVGLEIHIGWNRIVRRVFEALGYEVVKLDRSVYATLDKKDLQRGHWRFLRQDEVVRLKHFQ
ncbi:MAG: rRNA pseudouridine synthase, partial [Cyclobacteriaceae bacterium]|nr:rRNA pseudouridine synthase [Cyclobacteriaceae bacterium]